jgi:hypothetical protein
MTNTPEPTQAEGIAPDPQGPKPKSSSRETQRLSLELALGAVDVDAKAAMRRTVHISLRPEEIEELSGPAPTRRKTIRVKKPALPAMDSAPAGAAPAVRHQLPRPVAGSAEWQEPSLPVAPGEAAPNPVFLVAAVAAILIVCVLIYVLAAQAIGPDDSLTTLSYYRSGPRLAWPGQIDRRVP